MEQTPSKKKTPIQQFFADKTVFVTGGTGFLGCLVIEKILRSCPQVKRIYVIIRPKKGVHITERLQKIFDSVAFDLLRKTNPDFHKKIEVIAGDCEESGLGLSYEDYEKLTNEVNVVFHCAATVRFDEQIRKAVRINVIATRDLLLLAKMMTNLKAFVYVGTAYSHCNRKVVDEHFYESPIDPDKLISAVDALDDDTLEFLTPKLLCDWPNTYSFTKAVAEEIVRVYGRTLPVTVVRPSIVISTYKEPVGGYINNYYGFSGVLAACGVGLMHAFRVKLNYNADVVPADYVVNSMIAAAWSLQNNDNRSAVTSGKETDISIYNYVNYPCNPLSWKTAIDSSYEYGLRTPSVKAITPVYCMTAENKYYHLFLVIVVHYIQGAIMDLAAMALGKQPKLIDVYKKMNKFASVLEFFSCNEWHFSNHNTSSLFESLDEADKKLFNFNLALMKWSDYFPVYTLGLRMHLIKDPIDTVAQGIKRYQILKTLYYSVTIIFALGLMYVAWRLTAAIIS